MPCFQISLNIFIFQSGNAQVSPEKAFEVINQLKMQNMVPQQQQYNPQVMGQR